MKKILTALLAATMVISMTACGAKTEKPTENPTEKPAETTPTETPTTPTTDDGKFTVGMECNYAPFNWTQVDKTDTTVSLGGAGEADGYDVMVAKYLADKMGKELEIKKVEWTGLEPALNAGEIDAIIAGMTDTPERRQNADFTTPYYESDMVMIVRADDPLKDAKSLEDFKGKNILGQMNTMYDGVIDQIPEVKHAVPLASYPLMVVSLQSKDTDGITAELPVARGVVASNPDLAIVTFEKGKGFEADTSVSIAVKKGNTALKDELQKALDTLPQDQRLDWMGAAVERQPATK